MSRGGKYSKNENEDDEVEKLLRATEDDILLKLSVDSHMSSSRIIHPDLDRRFQALRSSKPPPSSTANNKASASVVNDDHGDDLFARFAALKSTLPSYSNKNEQVEINEHDDEGDEVIRWAIDAAALDPSPPSDDDVSVNSSDEEQTDDDDDEYEDDIKKKDKKKKKKGQQK